MEIKIEKGVPFPANLRGETSRLLMKMEAGDSFFIPDNGRLAAEQRKWIQAGLRNDVRVATRRENGGLRVWRLV